MAQSIGAQDLKTWLSDGREIALLDVRELGQYGAGHPFFAVPCPYSRLEVRLPDLVPNRATRTVLLDDGDGVAAKAAARAADLGYGALFVLDGGAPAWAAAGFTLYEGVNLPSKTFGELLELERHTPRMTAREVEDLRTSGKPHIIVDGRPFSEYQKFNIPGGICCPNGELALRIGALAPDPETTIVVNCAGRTRSILGAQTLIDAGIENPVYALENGTQGWFLEGLDLETGATRRGDGAAPQDLAALQKKIAGFVAANDIPMVKAEAVEAWAADTDRTLYLIDVRRPEDHARDGFAGTVKAAGGQLVQATDQWVGVRNARIVLFDDDGVRAPLVCNWLRRMGHDAMVLTGGLAAARSTAARLAEGQTDLDLGPALSELSPRTVAERAERPMLIDLRGSMDYRAGHIDGAEWAIRPRLDRLSLQAGVEVVLIAETADIAQLAASDLRKAGVSNLARLTGRPEDWVGAGLPCVASETPVAADCIDYVFFTHTRHDGDEAAARAYLTWEIGLVDQLDEQERGVFRP